MSRRRLSLLVILCIDFNGVIEDSKNVEKGRKLGPPMPGAVDALQDLYQSHTLIIHTTMANTPSGRRAVADWLEYYDVDYSEIVGKPKADCYLDDKGQKFISWKSAMIKLDN